LFFSGSVDLGSTTSPSTNDFLTVNFAHGVLRRRERLSQSDQTRDRNLAPVRLELIYRDVGRERGRPERTGNATALGTNAATSPLIVASGAALQLQGGLTLPKFIIVSGSGVPFVAPFGAGVPNAGVIENVSGVNVLSQSVYDGGRHLDRNRPECRE